MNIQLPTKKGQPNTTPNIDFQQLVIVGANGSGKTRFGSDIEKRYLAQTHRISAQKSLTFPNEVSPKSKKRAEIEFLYGYYYENQPNDQLSIDNKGNSRWNNNFNTFLLNDYEKLLVLLHTEEYEESLNYKEGRTGKPITKLDKVQRIWELVLPHRKLHKIAGVIQAYPSGQEASKYNASEMSDGERVIFYLAAEVICAPINSIIIIDEPEMHIHSSLIKPFFDLIEAERPDCSLIYLTHNIDFAFTRQNAKKIWAKSYENNVWDYEILDENLPIPEQLYLDVLGSRKPIIFLEGDSSSIDYELYEQVYDDKTLKPIGSCDKVVQVVKAFREQQGFHHIESFGIIDRDRRLQADVIALNRNGVWVLDVAEAENLLLIEPIIKEVAGHMGRDVNEVFLQVRQNIITFFANQIDSQILLHYKEMLRREYLALSNFTSQNIASALIEIESTFGGIDKQAIYTHIDTEFKDILTRQDYDAILRVFNLKNALIPNSKVCELTGIRNKLEYKNITVTLLKQKNAISNNIKAGIDSKIIKNAT
jgi:ABC-type dipeptide/oligopeptide/nickel transport system ATPase component